MFFMKRKQSSWIYFLMSWLLTFALLVTWSPAVTLASEEIDESIPVELKISPDKDRYSPGTKIQIEAVTKKEGKSFEAKIVVKAKMDKEHTITIEPETKIKGKSYVSKATFTPEDIIGNNAGSLGIEFEIILSDTNKMWVGKTNKRIFVDNMPETVPSVDSEFFILPEQKLKVGEKIKFTVHTPYKGIIREDAKFLFFSFNSVDTTQKVEKVRTIHDRKKGMYVTTGYFTPRKEGTYTPFFFLEMYDKEKDEDISGSGVIKFDVIANPKIETSLSPQTITIKLGDEIYLLLTYQATGMDSAKFSREYNYDVTEINEEYDEENKTYKVLLKFKPEQKKTHKFEATVKNIETDTKATAKTTIYVK
ncbi:hypothetical protein ABER61_19775 [Brevibacillus formosus]|uniref:Uncharacterized protein n=3 Tax=Brevibacillus formosus TaxID=54913 RepID=A0A837KS45_9BACL|nr:hypothetical protein [Brevibacillus formosus]KLI00511.1 hypothetical protein AA984_00950 [Brevibacillus formosus]PSJ92509.1 hypothetical protein C7R91_23310 [Brevibacillus formosus]GED57898.1 hypothetical protein BFO01nite_20300 [Brevibacillus formosus]